jgi:hypothetical protein
LTQQTRRGILVAVHQHYKIEQLAIGISGLQLPSRCDQIAGNAFGNGLAGFLDTFFWELAIMENVHLPTVPCKGLDLAVSPWRSVVRQAEIGEFRKAIAGILNGLNSQPMRAPELRDTALVCGIFSHAVNENPAQRRVAI